MDDKDDFEIALCDALDLLHTNKVNDRSEADRWYAILITDLEKAYACYQEYIKDE